MSDTTTKVRLESVFRWTCPACRKVNVEAWEQWDVSEDEARDLRLLEPWESLEEGHGITGARVPERVRCNGCEALYPCEAPEGWTDPSRDAGA